MDGRIHLRSNIGINDDIEVHATSKELLVNQIYEYWASLANNAESPSLATGRSLSPPSTKLLVHWKRNRYRETFGKWAQYYNSLIHNFSIRFYCNYQLQALLQ
jgi:hypothetical protein